MANLARLALTQLDLYGKWQRSAYLSVIEKQEIITNVKISSGDVEMGSSIHMFYKGEIELRTTLNHAKERQLGGDLWT